MSDSLFRIYSALSAPLTTLSPSRPIAWENQQYDPVHGTAYLEPLHVLNEIEPASLGQGGLNQHRGILQINVVWPKDGGAKAPRDLMDQLRTIYARGTRLTSGSVTVTIESSSTTMPIPDKAWTRYPLFITWRCHIAD